MARLKPATVICAIVLSGVAHAWHGELPDDPLVRVYYDYEVVQYCSLATAKIIAGFRRQLASIVAETGANKDAIEAARSVAWKAAHLEWQNRGLGGFRRWCDNEGRQAVKRFGGA